MAIIICMRGYPGCGKSTLAKQLAEGTGAVIVSRDTLRRSMFGKFHGVDEGAVSVAETGAVTAALAAGRSVVIDAMHLDPKYLRQWARVAREYGAEFDIVDVPTAVDVCVARDAERVDAGKCVGRARILEMAATWPQSSWPSVAALTS